jgi:hypothetical protein
VYNNHVFVQHDDARLGADDKINWDAPSGYAIQKYKLPLAAAAQPVHIYGGVPTQSLPDFDNPCSRIWNRYFAQNATASWFRSNHSISQSQFQADCNETVKSWRQGVRQIR